jgi:hypothetical protein
MTKKIEANDVGYSNLYFYNENELCKNLSRDNVHLKCKEPSFFENSWLFHEKCFLLTASERIKKCLDM